MQWLVALQRHPPAGWGKEPPGWPFNWEEEIRFAMFAFVTSRDNLKVGSMANARRKGGQNKARKHAERDKKIRAVYDHLSKHREDAIQLLHNHWKKYVDANSEPLSEARLRAIIKPRRRKSD